MVREDTAVVLDVAQIRNSAAVISAARMGVILQVRGVRVIRVLVKVSADKLAVVVKSSA
jgi:hypothetical protein